MTLPLLAVAISLVAAFLLMRVVRGNLGAQRIQSLDDLSGKTVPVDLEAFQNLISPSEDAYLRSALPLRDYKKLRRLRTRAAVEYLGRVAHNAAVLLRLGEAAQQSESSEIADAARQLVNTALAVRINALLAIVRLYLSLALPVGNAFCDRAIEHYAALRNVFGNLGKLQNPALNARLAGGL
jgi:hypothetical protein